MSTPDYLTIDEKYNINQDLRKYSEISELEPIEKNIYRELYTVREEYYDNLNNLSLLELKQLMSNGSVDIFTEADNGNSSLWERFLEAARGFFDRMLNVFIGIWKWMTRKYDTVYSSNQAFVKRYGRLLKDVHNVTLNANGDIVWQMFPTEIEAPKIYKLQIPKCLEKNVNSNNVDFTDAEYNDIKLKIIKEISNDKIQAVPSNLTEAFKNLYFGQPVTSSTYVFSIEEQLAIISKGESIKREFTVSFKAAEAELLTLRTLLKSARIINVNPQASSITRYIELAKFNSEALYAAYSQYCKAVMLRAIQARNICIEALKALTAGASTNETANILGLDEEIITESKPIEFKTLRKAINEYQYY